MARRGSSRTTRTRRRKPSVCSHRSLSGSNPQRTRLVAEHREVRYATPSLTRAQNANWFVAARPWQDFVGTLSEHPSGWLATTATGRMLGLFPHKQAAAEVLVKQAGYEVGEL